MAKPEIILNMILYLVVPPSRKNNGPLTAGVGTATGLNKRLSGKRRFPSTNPFTTFTQYLHFNYIRGHLEERSTDWGRKGASEEMRPFLLRRSCKPTPGLAGKVSKLPLVQDNLKEGRKAALFATRFIEPCLGFSGWGCIAHQAL